MTTKNHIHLKTNGDSALHEPRNGAILPLYDDLPSIPPLSQRGSWGVWDRYTGQSSNGPDDLGCLNLLTPSAKLAAAQEVSTGESFALNWKYEALHSGRRRRSHRVIPLDEDGSEWVGNDDEVEFNTQGGSQWDGFRHWAHQPSKLFYNGVSQADIHGTSCRNGIDKWSQAGGVTGRAVLLDYAAWKESLGETIDHNQRFPITLSDLKAIIEWENVTLRQGDILLIRCGFIKWYEQLSSSEQDKAGRRAHWSGVEGSEEVIRWIWNNHFAAVGGDAAVFEYWPAPDERWRLHDNLIALLGIPMGEMFDLEALSKACRRHGKWSCLFTSAPINIPGGVASPPNAICIL